MRRERRSALVLAALPLAALGASVLGQGCAESYAPPCSVTAEVFAIRELSLPLGMGGRLLPLLHVQADNSVDLTWLSSGVVTYEGASVPFIARADFLALGPDGTPSKRLAVAAPSALAARRGHTTPLGAGALPDGLLFPWIEEEVSTRPDGSERARSRVRSQFVKWDGTSLPLETFEAVTCDNCTFRATLAHARDSAVVLLDVTHEDESKALFYVYYTSAGAMVRTEELPWARRAAPLSSTEVDRGVGTIRVDRGYNVETIDHEYVVVGNNEARFYDAAFRPVRGSVPIPVPDYGSIHRAGSNVIVAWPAVVDAESALRDDSAVGRGEGRALLVEQRKLDTGTSLRPPQRFSVGAAVLGVAGLGAVLRTSDGSDYFARLTESGDKLGGDVLLSAVPGTTLSILHEAGSRALVDYRAGAGVLFRRSIVCAP